MRTWVSRFPWCRFPTHAELRSHVEGHSGTREKRASIQSAAAFAGVRTDRRFVDPTSRPTQSGGTHGYPVQPPNPVLDV